jgi:hypothetical protein
MSDKPKPHVHLRDGDCDCYYHKDEYQDVTADEAREWLKRKARLRPLDRPFVTYLRHLMRVVPHDVLIDQLRKDERDKCEICHGFRGGVRGNENRVDGIVMCDYCHATIAAYQAIKEKRGNEA